MTLPLQIGRAGYHGYGFDKHLEMYLLYLKELHTVNFANLMTELYE